MRRSVYIIAAIVLALGVVEGVSYWWMHPAPVGHGERVLVYRPSRSANVSPVVKNPEAKVQENANQVAQNPTSTFHVGSSMLDVHTPSSPSTFNPQLPTSSILTPLPEIYDKAAPMLRCSSGQVLHATLDDSSGIHLAFFEWDGTDTGSVLEAFRHMPEACMGSIGMKLVSHEKPRTYTVREQGLGARGQGAEVSDQENANGIARNTTSTFDVKSSELDVPSSSAHQKSAINNPHSSISPSSVGETLTFDHTVFREGGGVTGPASLIHAFRAVWVSGVPMADAREGLGGDEFDRLRTIRLKSALHRFRPAHARVIQGAVRGIPDPQLAWQAFEKAMLKDLSYQ